MAKGTINPNATCCDPIQNGFQLKETYVVGKDGEELTMFDGGDWQRTNVCMVYDNFGNRAASSQQTASRPAQESTLTPTVSYGASERGMSQL